MNRVWRWHFGAGLVRSVDNFGRLGETPSHPELLDWLATQFISDGWSLKKLHRRILLSQSWQMSGEWNEQAAQADPENRLLWRFDRRRLDAEGLRDSLLFVSGQLDETMGGTLLESAPFQNLSVSGAARKAELYQPPRRSVYLPVLRSALYDMFQAFDFPDPALLNGNRATTTVAAQALFMMNSPLVETAAEQMADRLLSVAASDHERLRDACRRIFGREAADAELSEWQAFLDRYQATPSLAEETIETRRRLAWQGLCRALFSSNEFIYVH